MAKCVLYRYTSEDPENPGVYLEVYEQVETTLDDCAAVDASERIVLPVSEYTGDMSASSFFATDYLTVAQKQEIFAYTFSLPLIVYLVAWAYQLVINFATKNDN